MATDRPAPQPVTWRGGSPHRPGPQLPAFCRSRRPPVLITLTSRFGLGLRLLLVLGLLLQLSTLLLLISGPVPPRPMTSTNTVFRPAAGTDAGEIPPVKPFSER